MLPFESRYYLSCFIQRVVNLEIQVVATTQLWTQLLDYNTKFISELENPGMI
jgi:hypothetical protein